MPPDADTAACSEATLAAICHSPTVTPTPPDADTLAEIGDPSADAVMGWLVIAAEISMSHVIFSYDTIASMSPAAEAESLSESPSAR